jgi:hypothetical protein
MRLMRSSLKGCREKGRGREEEKKEGRQDLTYFELVLEEIFLVGKLAVEAEKTLFVGREGL